MGGRKAKTEEDAIVMAQCTKCDRIFVQHDGVDEAKECPFCGSELFTPFELDIDKAIDVVCDGSIQEKARR